MGNGRVRACTEGWVRFVEGGGDSNVVRVVRKGKRGMGVGLEVVDHNVVSVRQVGRRVPDGSHWLVGVVVSGGCDL